MNETIRLHHPWMIAVWPGMGHVALNAGVYLLAKLDMKLLAELDTGGLFDIDSVEVEEGIVRPVKPPRNRLFVWKDAKEEHDLVVFLGEAQPPLGKYRFCQQLVAHARELGVERVFTFAAMATQMHLEQASRVFVAATDPEALEELKRLDVECLREGHISGLNGVLLGAAAEGGLRAACLLGEMPHLFGQLPYPKASLAILETFAPLAGIDLDLTELSEQAQAVDRQLGELLERMAQTYGQQIGEEEGAAEGATEEEAISPADRRRIEGLFAEAAKDRSKAFELKQELDKLGVFREYEDRFLDLFRSAQ